MGKGREKPFSYQKGRELPIWDVKIFKNAEKTFFFDLDKKRCPKGVAGSKCTSAGLWVPVSTWPAEEQNPPKDVFQGLQAWTRT